MKSCMLSFLLLLTGFSSSAAIPAPDMQALVNIDRELSGLLDAYLEAVPECPARPDTPLRLWVLDLAWLRAGSAIEMLDSMEPQPDLPDSGKESWDDFVSSAGELFRVYSEIQGAYRGAILPDSSVCIELEDRLLRADSVWRRSETALFEVLAEEGIQ